jgi:hypothetical protein
VSLIFKFSCHVALKKVQGPHVTWDRDMRMCVHIKE